MVLKKLFYSAKTTENLKQLLQKEDKVIINIPITQHLYDKLTFLAPVVWEIIIPQFASNNILEFKSHYEFIPVSLKIFELCKKYETKVLIQSNGAYIQTSALSPELAVIYTLRILDISRVFIAFGMLRTCNIDQLKMLVENYYMDQKKLIDFLLDLAHISLYRTDLVWEILKKYEYQNILRKFSLYVRDFIKEEYIYEKIM